MSESTKRIQILIRELEGSKSIKHGMTRSIKVNDMQTTDEIQNIILNALARYNIKHSYTWYSDKIPIDERRVKA